MNVPAQSSSVVVVLAVALGAGVGGVARVLVGAGAAHLPGPDFPYGVLIVNIAGSLLIGFLAALTAPCGRWPMGAAARQFAMAGCCGGFTTFSFFSLQTLELLRAGRAGAALLYAGLTLVLALAAVWLGHTAAQSLNRRAA